MESNATKQTLAPLQRSEGKTVAESEHARWQMDLAELNDNKGSERYALCVVNIFDRKLFTEPLPNKRPTTVREALKKILARAGGKPITISSDKGLEFTSAAMSDYLDSVSIAQRFKEPGDPNALGIVDRAIGLLKKKLATIGGTGGDRWGDALAKATTGLNATPKPEVLHGAAPDDVKGEPEVQFMLLQDNARKLQHNDALAAKRRTALERAGGKSATCGRRAPQVPQGLQGPLRPRAHGDERAGLHSQRRGWRTARPEAAPACARRGPRAARGLPATEARGVKGVQCTLGTGRMLGGGRVHRGQKACLWLYQKRRYFPNAYRLPQAARHGD